MESGSELIYDDFEVEVGIGTGRQYPVSVINSRAGEAHETMYFPFDELVLKNHLLALKNALLQSGGKYRLALSQEEQTVQDFGKELWNALLTDEVRNRYDVSLERANREGKGLRLKLRIQDPKLAAIPWEFMYEPRQHEYMSLSRSISIVRYIELPQPIQPLAVEPPLRILGMAASPTDLTPLDIARERQRVEEAVKSLQANGLVELTWLKGQTWRDLQEAMQTGVWHIFYFIGHGGFDCNADEGIIALADDEGKTQRFRATHLGRLLADHRSLRLVILNSCEGAKGSEHDIFSCTASILVQRGIPAVLAMQYEITDRAAIEFSRAFYKALSNGLPVDAAVTEARKAVSFAIENTIEWGTPVLYMRAPDGVLFNIQKQKPKDKEKAYRLKQKRQKEHSEKEYYVKEEESKARKEEQPEKEQRDIDVGEKETKISQLTLQKESAQEGREQEEQRKKKRRMLIAEIAIVVIALIAMAYFALPESSELTNIKVSPAEASVVEGYSQSFTALTLDQTGSPIIAEVLWSSSNPAVGTIDPSGRFTAKAAGITIITASGGSVSNTATVTVIQPAISQTATATVTQTVISHTSPAIQSIAVSTEIRISPATASVIAGNTYEFSALALDQLGKPITSPVAWSSSNTAVGTIDSTGKFTALTAGSTIVTASSGSASDTATVTVMTAPVLTTIGISPAAASVFVGNTQSFTALTLDQFNKSIPATVIWSSSNPSAGIIDSTGRFAALAKGITTITASSGSVMDTATVSVIEVSILTEIRILPASASVDIGDIQTFTALTLDQSNNSITSPVSWSSSNPAVGTIDSTGKFTALAAGTTTLTASSGPVSNTTTVTVLPSPIMEFVLMPAGEFDMGSSSTDSFDIERPVHHVKIANSFYMGKYEVTQKQWRDVMGTTPSYFTGDDLPVEMVSWDDVQQFITELNSKEGTAKYRLPSEAEWEYAARAGTTTLYSFGDDESKLGDYAWYSDNSGGETHPVGQKKPNPWGLYDMHGNVWEWVQDSWHENYNGAPLYGSAWESGSVANRVDRGGGWRYTARGSRSSYRTNSDPGNRGNYLGFRLVRDL